MEEDEHQRAPLAGSDAAEKAVNAIFADLRDRRFLKWLFGEPGSPMGVMPGLERLDDEIQVQIASKWAGIIRATLTS